MKKAKESTRRTAGEEQAKRVLASLDWDKLETIGKEDEAQATLEEWDE